MTRSEALAPLAERNFRWYFASRLVNTLGSTMASVALAFAVLDITDSPAALGQVLAAHTVPMVALLLWGGVISDRYSRAVVLQCSNVVSAVSQGVIAVLVLSGHAELWHLVVLSLVHGSASAIGFPAMASIMPSLVPTGQLQQANALVSLTRSGLAVLGPSLGALLVVAVGSGWALAVDATTWALSAVLLLGVRIPGRRRETPTESTFEELRAGWRYVRSTTWLWVVVLAFGVLNAIHTGSISTLGPIVAQDSIGRQAWGYVLSAEALGFVAMTLVLLKVRVTRPLLHGMVGVSLIALPILILGVEPHLVALVVAAFVAGAGTEVFGMGWNLAMQEHVPPQMLSRAYSYDALGSFVAMPLGQLAWGPLALAFGFSEVLVVSAVVYASVCVLVLCSAQVRGLRRVESTPLGPTRA